MSIHTCRPSVINSNRWVERCCRRRRWTPYRFDRISLNSINKQWRREKRHAWHDLFIKISHHKIHLHWICAHLDIRCYLSFVFFDKATGRGAERKEERRKCIQKSYSFFLSCSLAGTICSFFLLSLSQLRKREEEVEVDLCSSLNSLGWRGLIISSHCSVLSLSI